jgi:hypothetical protein
MFGRRKEIAQIKRDYRERIAELTEKLLQSERERSTALARASAYYDNWMQLRAKHVVTAPELHGMWLAECKRGIEFIGGQDVEILRYIFVPDHDADQEHQL